MKRVIERSKPLPIQEQAAQLLLDTVASWHRMMSYLDDMNEDELQEFFRLIKPVMDSTYKIGELTLGTLRTRMQKRKWSSKH